MQDIAARNAIPPCQRRINNHHQFITLPSAMASHLSADGNWRSRLSGIKCDIPNADQ